MAQSKEQGRPSSKRAAPSPLREATPPGSATIPRENLPRPQFSSEHASANATTPKPKARDLLRKHYGLGIGPPPPIPSNQNDPMNMDSLAFDAKSYYDQLITTSSLPSLLRREVELLAEIRQLDGERQSLVYNHHHELIAARDTIAAMKVGADGLDADLDMLRAAFSEISRLTNEVSIEHRLNSGS